MAGALSSVAGDDVADDGYDPSYDGAANPNYSGEDPVSPLRQSAQPPNPYAAGLYKTGERLIGDPDDPKGALSKFQDLPAAREQASQKQLEGIRRAMSVLSATGQDHYNLPALTFYAGLVGGGTGFGADVGRATNSMVEQIEKQRAIDRGIAKDLAGYEVNIGALPGQTLTQQAGDYQKMLQEGRGFETAGATAQTRETLAREMTDRQLGVQGLRNEGQENAAQIRAQASRDVAEINSGSRLSIAGLNANRNRYEYIGPVRGQPGVGLYHDKTTNATSFGPQADPKTAAGGGKTMEIMDVLRGENKNLTYADALRLVQRAPNLTEMQLKVEANALNAAKADLDYIGDPTGTWLKWRGQFGLPSDPSYLGKIGISPTAGGAAAPPSPLPRPVAPPASTAPPAAGPSPAPQPSAVPVRPGPDGVYHPRSTAEFNAIPNGQKFINPADGQLRIKTK